MAWKEQPEGVSGLIIAIEGGGTKTHGWLARGDPRQPEILAEALAGPANVHTSALEPLSTLLDRLCQELLQQGGVGREAVAALSLAMAGSDSAVDREKLSRALATWTIPASLATDARATLVGATGGAGGILLIAGTGSIAYGYTPDGREARCGGWGPAVGDEGAGYRLGWEALVHATRALDGRVRLTPLVDHISEELGLDSPALLGAWIREHASIPRDVARVSPAVTRAAASGDPVACRIAKAGAKQLVQMVKSVQRALKPGDDFHLVLHGGLLVDDLDYAEMVRAELTRTFPRCRMSVSQAEDVLAGCLMLAAQAMEVAS